MGRVKINEQYVAELFETLKEHESIHVPYDGGYKPDKIRKHLGLFLDVVNLCAEIKDIEETILRENYADVGYCYWVKRNDTVIEVGLEYQNNIVYASIYPKNVIEEDIIDSKDVIEEAKREKFGCTGEEFTQESKSWKIKVSPFGEALYLDTGDSKPPKKYGLKVHNGKKKKQEENK